MRSLLIASGVLLITSSVRAEQPRNAATLTYLPRPTTGGVCPAAEFFELEVEIRLGYELFQRSAPNHLTVEVERVDAQFRAVGEMRDATGKVVFSEAHLEPECTAAVIDMAMAIALELTRPPSESEASSPASSAQLLTAASCSRAPAATPSPPPPDASPPKLSRLVGLTSVFAYGKAPAIVGGLGWFFGLRRREVEVAVEARALVAPAAEVESFRARTGYRYLYAAVSVAGCYHKWWLFTCAHAELGNLSVKTTRIEINPNEVTLFSAGIRFGGERILMPGLAIRIFADVYKEMLEPSFFRTEGLLAAWTVPAISAAVGLGPVLCWDC